MDQKKRHPLQASRKKFRENERDLGGKQAAITQCLYNNGPLMGFFLSGGAASLPEDVAKEFPDLGAAIGWCTEVAKAAAREITGREDPTAAEVRPFRNAIVKHLATCLRAGRSPDVSELHSNLRQIAAVADRNIDSNPFREFKPDNAAMLTFTSVSTGLHLMEAIDVYSFRQPAEDVALRLSRCVAETAARMVEALVPEETDESNRLNLAQACIGKLGELMVGIYRHNAARVVSHLAGQPEAYKVKKLEENDYISEIEEEFVAKADLYRKVVSEMRTMPWDDINLTVTGLEQDTPQLQ